MTLKKIIDTFLSNFNYLNEKDKRKGLIFFSNKALTKDLESLAKGLKDDLNALVNEESKKEDAEKFADFTRLIKASFQNANHVRVKNASIKTYYSYTPPLSGSKEGMTLAYEYKNPLKPSKFEKALLKGLEAVNLELNASIQGGRLTDEQKKPFISLKALCSDLIYDISHFNPPKEIIIADHSYVP